MNASSRPGPWASMGRELARSFRETMLQIIVEGALASLVIAVCAVVGFAINGSTGAFYGGVLGLVAYIALRYVVIVAILAWGAGSWLAQLLRSR